MQSLWAKSPRSLGDSLGYPLLPHLLDVAAVAMELQSLVPCPVPLPSSTQWLAALVGFHDLGKSTPGFQLKLGPGAGAGFSLPSGAPDRHDASTVPLLTQQLVRRSTHTRGDGPVRHLPGRGVQTVLPTHVGMVRTNLAQRVLIWEDRLHGQTNEQCLRKDRQRTLKTAK